LTVLSSTSTSAPAEALFPSDDSDYESANGSEDARSSLVKLPRRRSAVAQKAKVLEDADDSLADDGNFFVQFSEIAHPTQQKFQVGSVVLVDPFDIIADWVSGKFVEQSLQWRAANGGDIDDDEKIMGEIFSTQNQTGCIIESYPPGSTLDAIAKASATLTPLSYQVRTIVRVMLPSIVFAILGKAIYPDLAQWLVHLHGNYPTNNSLLYTDDVLAVVSNDLSQYIQNILTTCALLFGILVGQTYYFMYQQQEMVFYALFKEVTEAKSLLEQISLVSYGRPGLYPSLLSRMNDYVQNDLKMLSSRDPIAITSALPKEDPLESILYATSVGVPGVVYETVKSLRQARADRCGALQRKLPTLHIYCLRLLGVIVLASFPVCGSGSQAIAPNVLILQSYMFGVLVFGLTLVVNVVEELRNSRRRGAYNVDGVLRVMVGGLERELEERLDGRFWGVGVSPSLPLRVVDVNVFGDTGWKTSFEDDIDENREVMNSEESGSKNVDSRRRKLKEWFLKKVFRK